MGYKVTRFSSFWTAFFLVALSLGSLSLASCVSLPDPETSQDFNKDVIAVVSPDHSVGQTFISHRPRLDGITLWLESDAPTTPVSLALFHSPTEEPLFTTTIEPSNGQNKIGIPPQSDPPNQVYFIELTTSRGEMRVLGRNEDIYWNGSAFLDGQPYGADLAFRTTYDYDWKAVLLDLRWGIGHWWLIFPLGLLLLLPGWLLLDLSVLGERFDFGEKTAISLGLSLAFAPVLMVWTSTFNLKWNRGSVWVGAALMLGVFIWRLVRKFQVEGYRLNKNQVINQQPTTIIILLSIFLISALVRFAMVRDLAAPAWVDSVHHAVITQRILETGGFPENYAPYIPIEASQYHPGYHSLLAAFIWLSGLELPNAMLIFGQVLNSLIIFPTYLLTKTFTKNRNAGLSAALIAGLFTLMPAYYASWGRYTQLAGLLILPTGFLWLKIMPSHKKDWMPTILLGSLTLTGLLIVHYRVVAFLGCLLLADWIAQIHLPMHGFFRKISNPLKYLIILGITSLLLSLPWLIPTFRDFIIPMSQRLGRGTTGLVKINWRYLSPALGIPALVMAGLGLILGIVKRQKVALTVLLWVTFLFLIANPRIFGLPFPAGFVNQSSVEIMLFLPISILGGYLVGEVIAGLEKFIPTHWVIVSKGAILLLGAGAVLLGAQRLLPTLNPVTFLFREADYAAMAWIRENIPEDEVVVINPTGWGYGLYMGNDGGYWIAPLTDRQTMPPSALYGMSNKTRQEVNGFVESLLPIGEDAEALENLLREYGFHYVYLGGRGGVISPRSLDESDLFETIYHFENTWVFEIQP
jgi:hypothetical protein